MSAEAVGATVRSARESAGLSQAVLAELMGMNDLTISRIESGRRKLSWEEGKTLQTLIGFDTHAPESQVARDAMKYRRILSIIEGEEGRTLAVDNPGDNPISSDAPRLEIYDEKGHMHVIDDPAVVRLLDNRWRERGTQAFREGWRAASDAFNGGAS